MTATRMQEWFEAGAADGFRISTDVYEDGTDTFVGQVIRILQEWVLFHTDYEGATLRDHPGIPQQYGRPARRSLYG